MTNESTFTSLTLLGTALSLSLFAATACGGSDDSDAENSGALSSASGGSGSVATAASGGSISGTGGTVGGGGTGSAESSTGGAGSADPATGGSNTGGSDTGDTCEAGSAVQGGGTDACPELAWQCVDETIGNPPVHLMGAECSTGHTGGCCNPSDKCLTQTEGSGSQSAVEVALGPCQVGCIANPSAQACLDCINTTLAGSGLPALSNGCGTCWTSLISCSFTNCLAPCAAGSTSTACRECAFNQCLVGPGKFNECSGLLSNSGL